MDDGPPKRRPSGLLASQAGAGRWVGHASADHIGSRWLRALLGLSVVLLEHGARYSTLPILLLDAALIVAADAYARRWWPRPKAIAAVAALVAVLAVGWATDFRYPVRRLSGPHAVWQHTASSWLRRCQHKPAGTITVSFRDWWGPARLATTFSCSSLRR